MRWYPETSCLGSCGKSTATMETHFDGVWMGPRRIGCDGGWHLVRGECVPAGRRETCTSVGIGGAHLLALPLLSHGLLMPLDGILAILSLEDLLLIVELLHKILRSFEILGGLPCVLLLGEALPSDEVLLAHPPTCSSMHEVDLPFIANRVVRSRVRPCHKSKKYPVCSFSPLGLFNLFTIEQQQQSRNSCNKG